VCALILVAGGLLGLSSALLETFTPPATPELQEAARLSQFFEDAKDRLPRDHRVVVVTSLIPTPDLDYWFGMNRPVRILFAVDRARFERDAGAASIPATSTIREYYASKGNLLTKDSLDRALADATHLTITDAFAASEVKALAAALPGRIVMASEPMSIRDLRAK
jgi:hypothetical protein